MHYWPRTSSASLPVAGKKNKPHLVLIYVSTLYRHIVYLKTAVAGWMEVIASDSANTLKKNTGEVSDSHTFLCDTIRVFLTG